MFRIMVCAAALLTAATGAMTFGQAEPRVPFLGVFGEDVTADSGQRGAVIREVINDSPAAKAGLQRGDVVLSVNDQAVDGFADLSRKIRLFKPEEKVRFKVLRNGNEQTIEVELGSQPAGRSMPAVPFDFLPEGFQFRVPPRGNFQFQFPNPEEAAKRPMIGIELQVVDDALRKQLNLGDRKGVLVADVVKGGPAAKAGIESTDLIIEADGKPVEQPKDLADIVASKKVGDVVMLKIFRKGDVSELKVELEAIPMREWMRNPERSEQFRRYFGPDDRIEKMEKRIAELEEEVKALKKQLQEQNK